MNKFLEKFGPGGSMVKCDWWSDRVGSGLAAIGITTPVRDSLQGTVDHAISLLPAGGAVPAPVSNIGSIPQATGFSFQSSNTKIILGAVALVIVAVLIARRK